MKNPQDPHDPRLSRSGNRLFRNAAQQRQRKPSFSWAKVAIAVTVLFTSAGATFYYMGKGESPAPAPVAVAAADPAAQTSATQAAAAIPLITPAPPTPTPKPTPEPTPRAARKKTVAKAASEGTAKSKGASESPAKTKAKAKAKNKIDPPAKEVLTTGRREIVESGASRPAASRAEADSAAPSDVKSKPTTASTTKAAADTKPRATTKTASTTGKTVSKTKAAAAKPAETATDNTPPEAQRPRFNMRPDTMRSASTERVNNLKEFPAAPGEVDAPAAAKKAPAAKTKKKADDDSAAALPPVPIAPGREQSAAAAPAGKAMARVQNGLPGSVSQSATREEAAVSTAPPVPKVDLEDRSVEYQGPPDEGSAPVVVKGAARPYPVPRQVKPYRQERMASQPLYDRNGLRIPPPPFNGGPPPGRPIAPPAGRVAPARSNPRPAPPVPAERTVPPASSSNAGGTNAGSAIEFQDARPGNVSQQPSSSGPMEKMAGQLSHIDGVEVKVVPE